MRVTYQPLLRVLVLVVLMTFVAGCASDTATDSNTMETSEPASTAQSLPTTMPDLAGLTVTQVHELLFGLGDGVTVTFPSEELSLTIAAKEIAGTALPERTMTWTVPERTIGLSEASTEHYVVSEQSLATGEPLSFTTQLHLVATPNWNPEEPWPGVGHVQAVNSDGGTRCFDCHEEDGCMDCHLALSDAIPPE